MKVFVLSMANTSYDSYDGHVVVAESEEQARELCPCADECEGSRTDPHDCVWKDPSKTTCAEVDTSTPGLVLSSFLAG